MDISGVGDVEVYVGRYMRLTVVRVSRLKVMMSWI